MLIGYICILIEDESLLLEQKLECLKEASCKQFFIDEIAAHNNTRLGLDNAITYARENDILVVCSLKDLISGVRQFKSVMERLSEGRIDLKVIEGDLGDIKADEINGELILKVSTLLAEIQGRFISERTKEELERRKADGYKLGRPSQFEQWKPKLIEMSAAGYSPSQMSRETGLSAITVKSYLRQIDM